jgi:hypothetical protein
MSYIVAFVRLPGTSKEYPVRCFRTDIKPEDAVIVELFGDRFEIGRVSAVKYLDWDCKARLVCKVGEGEITSRGVQFAPGTPRSVGIVSGEMLIARLRERGWTPYHSLVTYRMVLAFNNEFQTARILVRRHGVDFQVLSDLQALPPALSKASIATTEGRFVRHYLAHTTFNLYEGAIRFAEAFERNEGNYDRFFVSVGESDRRTVEQKAAAPRAERAHREDSGFYWHDDDDDGMAAGMDAWYDEMLARD